MAPTPAYINFPFDDDRTFHWISSEGGLLEAPVELRALSLAPGERAELLVDFGNGRPATLVTGADSNVMMGAMGRMGRGVSRTLRLGREPVLAFEPSGVALQAKALPARMAARAIVDPSKAVKRRRFGLDMGMGMMGRMMGDDAGRRAAESVAALASPR